MPLLHYCIHENVTKIAHFKERKNSHEKDWCGPMKLSAQQINIIVRCYTCKIDVMSENWRSDQVPTISL